MILNIGTRSWVGIGSLVFATTLLPMASSIAGKVPTVLTQIQGMTNEAGSPPKTASFPWLTVATQNISSQGAEFALERAEVNDGSLHWPESVGFLAMQSEQVGQFKDLSGQWIKYQTLLTTPVVSGWGNGCRNIFLQKTSLQPPLAFASPITHRGDNGGWLRRCSLSGNHVGLTFDEDRFRDVERNHLGEAASLLVFTQPFSAQFSETNDNWRMEVGTIVLPATQGLNPGFTKITLKKHFGIKPIIFSLPSDEGGQPAALRIRNVTAGSFEIVQVEPKPEDGRHVAMTVQYLAVTPGVHQLPDGTRLHAGTLQTQKVQHGRGVIGAEGWQYQRFQLSNKPDENTPEGIAENTIAYVSSSRARKSIRLIQSDGSNNRHLWTEPANKLITPAIGSLAWKPDGAELAFDSDHAFGKSYYGRDLYAITADGRSLRNITNPPDFRDLKGFPKGGAKIHSQNWLGGGTNFWAYIEGSSVNSTWLAASIEDWTITFKDVADFGASIRQYAVVGYFGYNQRRMCRYDLAGSVDIEPGKTLNIAQNFDGWAHQFEHCYAVRQPVWSHDGKQILFTLVAGIDSFSDGPSENDIDRFLIKMSDTENLSPGNRGTKLNEYRTYNHDPRHIKLSPTREQELLIVTYHFRADRIYLSSTNDPDMSKPDRLQRVDLGFCNYGDGGTYLVDKCHISDIEWLPDGSGFIVSMHYQQRKPKQHFDRVYKHDLTTGKTDLLVSIEDEYVGDLSISPAGDKVVFERGLRNDGPYNLWTYDIAHHNLRLLVKDAAVPAWSPATK